MLFYGIIFYGIGLWGNSHRVYWALLLQKKVIHIIPNSAFRAHCKPLFVSDGSLTVVNVYIYTCLLHLKKDLHDYPFRSFVHTYSTRSMSINEQPYVGLSKLHCIVHIKLNKLQTTFSAWNVPFTQI